MTRRREQEAILLRSTRRRSNTRLTIPARDILRVATIPSLQGCTGRAVVVEVDTRPQLAMIITPVCQNYKKSKQESISNETDCFRQEKETDKKKIQQVRPVIHKATIRRHLRAEATMITITSLVR